MTNKKVCIEHKNKYVELPFSNFCEAGCGGWREFAVLLFIFRQWYAQHRRIDVSDAQASDQFVSNTKINPYLRCNRVVDFIAAGHSAFAHTHTRMHQMSFEFSDFAQFFSGCFRNMHSLSPRLQLSYTCGANEPPSTTALKFKWYARVWVGGEVGIQRWKMCV